MKALYKIINWYTQHFRFPFRGWKYFRSFLHRTGLDKKTYCKRLHNGSRMFVTPVEHIQQQIFWYGYYEKKAILMWESLVKDDFIILDIGANAGYYSLIAAAKLRTGQVHAFEPSSPARKEFEKNISLNGFMNIHVSPLAVTDKKDKLTFFISDPNNIGMSGLKAAENFSGNTETVNSISIDEWIRTENILKVNMIKIDIEGAEMKALQGMKEALRSFQPIIFIEINTGLLTKYENSPADIYQLLRSFEYNAYEAVKPNQLKLMNDAKEGDSIIFLPAQYILPKNIRLL